MASRGVSRIQTERRKAYVGRGDKPTRPVGDFAERDSIPTCTKTPQAAAQAIADLAQRIGASQLTEQHGDELRPAGQALGVTLSGVLLHESGELGSGKVLQQLIE